MVRMSGVAMPATPVLRGLREKDREFEDSLGYI
jgi:hypothetical protein